MLERYRYTIAAASIGLLMLPRLPGIGAQVNGAFLAIKVGPIQFQPAEFAKLGIIVFLASYLRETGDILVRPRLRPLPYQRQLLLWGIPAALTLLGVAVLDLGAGGIGSPRRCSCSRSRRSSATARRPSTSARCCSCGASRC